MNRASDSGSEGPGFESQRGHEKAKSPTIKQIVGDFLCGIGASFAEGGCPLRGTVGCMLSEGTLGRRGRHAGWTGEACWLDCFPRCPSPVRAHAGECGAFSAVLRLLCSVQCRAHFFPLVAQRLHGRKQQVGTGIEQHLPVERPCIDGYGKDAC